MTVAPARAAKWAAAAAAVAAAACAPVTWPLLAGKAAAGSALAAVFAQVGGVGDGLIGEVVIRAWDRLRGKPDLSERDLTEALAAELQESLAESTAEAMGLRAEITGVLRGLGAVQVALTATINESASHIQEMLISGLGDLSSQYAELGVQVSGISDQIARLAESQARVLACDSVE